MIYPQTCGICGKINSKAVCIKCKKELEKQKICTLDNYKDDNEKYFDEHFYLFKYDGIIRNKIINYKFNEKSYLYKTFTYFLLNNEKSFDFFKRYDIIIPVPISYKRYMERGYNQSALLAREISQNTNLEYNDTVLFKIKNIVAQSTLKKEDRIKNVKNVYGIKKHNAEKILEKNVLLVDDVYTTGSTVNECSRILNENGIKTIGILTIAKD